MVKIDHILFKKRVIDTIAGRDNWRESEVPKHTGCRLGKWYHTIDLREVREHPAFKAIDKPHARVHEAAKAALRAHEQGQKAASLEALAQLDLASTEVIAAIDKLAEAYERDLKHINKRDYMREPSEAKARIRGKNGESEIQVRDKSRSGLGAYGIDAEKVGQTFGVEVDGEEFVGEAVWSDGEKGGIRRLT